MKCYKLKIRKFSLIEMMVVMGVMAVILGISLPSFLKMAKGQSVEIAARTIGSKLNAVRTYAIANRKLTALVFITNNPDTPSQTGTDNIKPRYMYRAYRPCIVTASGSNYEFSEWVEDEKWEYLPKSTVLLGISSSIGSINSYSTASEITPGSANFDDARLFDNGIPNYLYGIIFKSTGDCVGNRKIIIVGEGTYVTGKTPNQQNASNILGVTVDNYTGRVSYGTD